MKATKSYTILFLLILVVPAFSFVAPQNIRFYVFYDTTTRDGDSIDVALKTLSSIAGNDIDIVLVPVYSTSDLRVDIQGPAVAALVFHGSEKGLMWNTYESSQVLITWTQLGQYIDSTQFNGYFILSCDSTRVDSLTQKEKVLSFVGDVDAKVASVIAMAHLQYLLRDYSLSSARAINSRIVSFIKSEDIINRFFSPVNPLTNHGRDDTTLYGLIINNMEYYLDAIRGQTKLIITEKSNEYRVYLAFEKIMNLVTGNMYGMIRDTSAVLSQILEDLDAVIQDFINGQVSASTFKNALSAVLDLWDLTEIAREFVLNSKVANVLMWTDLALFMADIFYTLYSVKAQVESTNYGGRNTFSDSLAVIMDDDSYREIVPYRALSERVSVYDAVENLLNILKESIDCSNIRNAAKSVIDVCNEALDEAEYIGGDIEYFTIMLLEGVRDSARALYDSGADYLDRYAADNFYYITSYSVASDWWAGELTISFSFTNPSTNQIPFYKITTKAVESNSGNTGSSSRTFINYLLPGDVYSGSYKIDYNRWKGHSVSFSWSITYLPQIDLKGDHIKGDYDGDGILDYDELHSTFGYKTCPTKSDTDGDGFSDKVEIDRGTNPLDPTDYPTGSNIGGGGIIIDPVLVP